MTTLGDLVVRPRTIYFLLSTPPVYALYSQDVHGQAHNFYSVPANWASITHPALVSFLSVPQRYYVPHRLRQMQQTRLAASGLWDLPAEEVEDKEAERKFGQKKDEKPDPKKVFKETFQRERVSLFVR